MCRVNANISDDERNSWPEISDGFLASALAAKRLFIAGEEIFLAADAVGGLIVVSLLVPWECLIPFQQQSLILMEYRIEIFRYSLISLTVGFLLVHGLDARVDR